MSDSEIMECEMSDEHPARFVEQALPEQNEISVAEHLAGSSRCAELVQQRRALRWLWAGRDAQASANAVELVSARD